MSINYARTPTEGLDMSQPDLVTRLARKWCPRHKTLSFVDRECVCAVIAAAIREALEEAKKIAGDEQRLWENSIDTRPLLERHGAVAASFTIAAALAALREG